MRRLIVTAVTTALLVGVGVTPSWASEEYFAAQALAARTAAEARAAALWGDTVSTENLPAAPEPVAAETLNPGEGVVVEADELGAQIEFSGFELDQPVTVEVAPLSDAVAASASSELAAVVLGDPFEVTATTDAGGDITEFPADPTIVEDEDGSDIVTDVDPGVAIEVAVPDLTGLDPASVRIVTRENPGDPWMEIPSYYDAETGTAKGEIDHLSQFAVIGTAFVPPPGPRIVLDPDDNVGWAHAPEYVTELPYNLRLANEVAAKLSEICLAVVDVTRPADTPDFVTASNRAGRAAAFNPQITVTLAFNALDGLTWGEDPAEGGSLVFSRGGAQDDALASWMTSVLPGYTSRPAQGRASDSYPYDAFDSIPGAMVHLETLFLDNAYDRAVIDSGFDFIVNGVATALGMYAESALGADCTDPATGGWPAKPDAATLEAWKQLGFHYFQTYQGDPVSMSTGNLLEDEPIFTLGGPGLQDLDLRLVYNSQDGRESRVGTGWSFGLGARAQRFDDGSVLAVRGDGASFVFSPDGAGGYTSDPDVRETLVEAGAGQLKLTGPAGQTWVYDASDIEGIGELVSYRDALGVGYDLTYGVPDEDDRFVPLASITDTAGQVVTLTPNAAGQIGTITHPDGRTWTLGYGDGGNLVSITNPDGRTRTFTYDGEHRMLTATNPAGEVYLVNEYDTASRVVKQWDADGNLRTFEYQGKILDGGTTVYTDNEGNETVYEWDEKSRITSITDALGGIEEFEYDEAGNTTAYTDQLGARTESAYDGQGNKTSEVLPDGTSRSYTYSPLGVLASVTDEGGPGGASRTTTFDVTPTGQMTAAHLPDGSTVIFSYTPHGDLASLTDQAGATTAFGYDAVGNLVSVTDPLGQVTTSTYDAAGRVLTTTDPSGAVTAYEWDTSDRVVAATDPLGGTTRYGYDATDRVASATDPLGATTEFEWDALGRLTSIVSPNGATTTYAYNAEDDLVSTTDAAGSTTVVERDALGRVILTTDALGQEWAAAYDLLGRTTSTTDPLGAVTGYEYDVMGRQTATTDAAGFRTTSTYDAVGRLASVTDAAGGTVSYAYTITDQLTSATDQAGRSTSYRYDAVGNRIESTDRRGQAWTASYDALGRITSETDPLGAVTRYLYDTLARTTSVVDPLGATTTTGLDALGRPVSHTDPLGSVATSTYDASSRMVASTDANGAVSTAEYDEVGNLISKTDAMGEVSTFEYDVVGQLTTATNPLGVTTAYDYDLLGRLVTVVQGQQAVPATATGSDINVMTKYEYTPWGQLASMTDAIGAVTRFEYDARGLPVAETNPIGITSRIEYDELGRPTRATDGNGGTTTTTYTSRSDVASIAYPDGTRVGFEYDADQNLILMTDNLGATGWVYDRAGQMTRQTDPNGATVDYSYDKAGRTASTSVSNGGTVGYTYDAAGRITAQSSPWGSLGYAYDKVGNILEQTRSTGVVTTFTYNALSQVTQLRHHTPLVAPERSSNASWVATPTDPLSQILAECPSGTGTISDSGEATAVSSYLKDRTVPGTDIAGCQKTAIYAAGRDFPDLEEVFAAGEAITYDYAYDATGNVTAELETIGAQSVTATNYAYDDLSRLTQSWASDGTVNTYRYDAVGNRTGWVTPKAPDTGEPLIVDSAFNKAGQLTSQYRARPYDGATSVGFGYDRNGNRTSEHTSGPDGSSTTNYTYTSTGRLLSATEEDVSTAYAYDGLGRQLRSSEDSWAGTTYSEQVWDGLTVIQRASEQTGTVGLLRDANGAVALQSRSVGDRTVTPAWLLQDRQGSTIATTSDAGRVTDLVDYSDYGVPVTGSTGLAAAAGYTGEITDVRPGANSYYARTYDTFTGTWLTPDTWRGMTINPTTLHRYAYVGGNPSSDVDILGFRPGMLIDGVGGVGSRPFTPAGVAAQETVGDEACDGKACGSSDIPAAHPDNDLSGLTGVLDAISLIAGFAAWIPGPQQPVFAAIAGLTGLASSLINCASNGLFSPDCIVDAVFALLGPIGRGMKATVGPLIKQAFKKLDDVAMPPSPKPKPNPSGGACSFSGDTEVLMADGTTKPISKVEVGDEVRATDPETGEDGARKVTRLWVHQDELLTLQLEDGAHVTTTEDHPFWNATDQQWQRADQLDEGDRLLTADGETSTVEGVDPDTAHQGTAFNLTVDDIHTYYVEVGDEQVLVHNKNTCERDGSPPPNLTPEGAGRPGAFNQAKIDAGIPTSQSPIATRPNTTRTGEPQPGYQYDFEVDRPGGNTEIVTIRDDAGGHIFPDNPTQNRGPHFNGPDGTSHYDY